MEIFSFDLMIWGLPIYWHCKEGICGILSWVSLGRVGAWDGFNEFQRGTHFDISLVKPLYLLNMAYFFYSWGSDVCPPCELGNVRIGGMDPPQERDLEIEGQLGLKGGRGLDETG